MQLKTLTGIAKYITTNTALELTSKYIDYNVNKKVLYITLDYDVSELLTTLKAMSMTMDMDNLIMLYEPVVCKGNKFDIIIVDGINKFDENSIDIGYISKTIPYLKPDGIMYVTATTNEKRNSNLVKTLICNYLRKESRYDIEVTEYSEGE